MVLGLGLPVELSPGDEGKITLGCLTGDVCVTCTSGGSRSWGVEEVPSKLSSSIESTTKASISDSSSETEEIATCILGAFRFAVEEAPAA